MESQRTFPPDGDRLTEINVLRAPAAERNKDAILEVIKGHVDLEKKLFGLEIASGPGQHIIHFATSLPNITWQPSDCDQNCVCSVAGYMMQYNHLKNILSPVNINVSVPVSEWKVPSLTQHCCDVIVCINMIHITDMSSVTGLFNASGQLLKTGAVLITYGPYMEDGVITPESNVRFDRNLKERDPNYGLRDIRDLKKIAEENDMTLVKKVDMPANNKMLIFRKM